MRNDDADMVSPFDRDAFRRASVMLDNDDDDDEFGTDAYRNAAAGYYNASSGAGAGGAGNRSMHSPHMSEYSMQSLTGAGVSRSNTMMMAGATAPGMHYHQQPAFDPSHVVPVMAPPPQAAYAVPGYAPHSSQLAPAIPAAALGGGGGDYHHDYHHQNGHGAPAALGAYPNLNRGPSQVSRNRGATLSVGAAADLSRRDSRASEYSQYSDSPAELAIPPPVAAAAGHGGGYPVTDERGLSLVHEVEEPYTPPSATNKRFADFQREQQQLEQRGHQDQAESVAAATHNGSEYNNTTYYRSGTPENANVQQTFFESSPHSQQHYGADDDPFDASSLPAYLPDGQVGHIGRSWSAEGGHGGGGDEDGDGDGEGGGDYAAAAAAKSGAGRREPQQHRRRLSVRNGGLDDFAEEEDEAVYYNKTAR